MDVRQPRRRSRPRVQPILLRGWRTAYNSPRTATGPNLDAVEDAFAWEIDYAMLVKQYGEGPNSPERKYSPSEYKGSKKIKLRGNPVKKDVSTSYVERQNLTMRMSMRRLTQLTNGFSKKIENHAHAVALHLMYYNFGRIHKSLRVTPAMEAGIADHVWSLEEIAALVPEPEAKPRGPYKKCSPTS